MILLMTSSISTPNFDSVFQEYAAYFLNKKCPDHSADFVLGLLRLILWGKLELTECFLRGLSSEYL